MIMDRVKKTILAALIIYLVYLAIKPFTTGNDKDALFGVVQAVFIGVVLGGIVAFYIAPHYFERMAMGIFFPSKNVRAAPPELSHIRSKIVSGNHKEALCELERMLMKDPHNIYVITLYADLLLDSMKDYGGTVDFLRAYFKSKVKRTGEDLPLLMKLVDAFCELDKPANAVELLEQELNMKYPKGDIEAIRRRLDSLKAG